MNKEKEEKDINEFYKRKDRIEEQLDNLLNPFVPGDTLDKVLEQMNKISELLKQVK